MDNNDIFKYDEAIRFCGVTQTCPPQPPYENKLWKRSRLIGLIFFTPIFSAFSPYAGKYGPEKTPNLDTFHAVYAILFSMKTSENQKG